MILFILALSLARAESSEPPLKAGFMISIVAWHAASQTYDVDLVGAAAEGPNYATLDNLISAIGAAPVAKWRRHPEAAVGNQYMLDRPLRLEPVLQIERLRKINLPHPERPPSLRR